MKKLLEQEKAYQARKEKENAKRLNKLRDELVKLKSFALMLVDERQMHIEQLGLQSQKVQDLTQKLREEEGPLTPHSYWYSQDGDGVFRSTGSNQLCVRHH